MNRPQDLAFDWFFNPLLTIKDQIKGEDLSPAEAEYFGKVVLFCGDPERMKILNTGFAHVSESKRAKLDALAQRLRGIMKSISRYPTYRRRFNDSMKALTDDLSKSNRENVPTKSVPKSPTSLQSKNVFARVFEQRFSRTRGCSGRNNEPQVGVDMDLDNNI